MAAPINYPEWASTSATLPETGGANKVQPSASLQTVGYDKNSVPTAEEENWLRANLYEWIVHLDESSQQATETVKGIAELATQAETDAGTNDTNIVTPLKLKSRLDSRVASETVSGLVELATDAETQGLSDDNRAVTPLKLDNAYRAANQSLGTSGYQKLPGGMIMQWGLISAMDGAGAVVNFPLAFPTACVNVNLQLTTTGTPSEANFSDNWVHTVGVASFTADTTHTVAYDYYWTAIGY